MNSTSGTAPGTVTRPWWRGTWGWQTGRPPATSSSSTRRAAHSSKEQYLGAIAAGVSRYLAREAGAIAVRLHGGVACLRYQALLEIIVCGEHVPPQLLWHADSYERRDGHWPVL